MKKYIFPIAIALIMSGCGNSAKLSAAADCGGTELRDNGSSVIGEYSKHELDGLICVLDTVNFPDWVRAELSSTRPIDGRKTAEWDGLIASWSYDGDGMSLVIRTK